MACRLAEQCRHPDRHPHDRLRECESPVFRLCKKRSAPPRRVASGCEGISDINTKPAWATLTFAICRSVMTMARHSPAGHWAWRSGASRATEAGPGRDEQPAAWNQQRIDGAKAA